MNSKTIRISIGLCVSSLLLSCGKGSFQSSNDSSTCSGASCQDQGGLGDGDTPNDPNTPDFSQAQGSIASDKASINGFVALTFDSKTKEFVVSIPLPSNFMVLTRGSIKQIPGATYASTIGSDGKPKLTIRLPANAVLRGVQFLPPGTLPNGDPLPAMPDGKGELPNIAIELPTNSSKTQVYLYVGINTVGIFVTLPSNFQIPFDFVYPIRNKDKTRTLGYFTYVAPKSNFAPGVFISSIIPSDLAKLLDDYVSR